MPSTAESTLKHIWLPCSQMKDYETFPPLEITKAEGPYLHFKNGHRVIDAISSWWCKSLGHQHPAIRQAILTQLDKYEHIIGTNTANETLNMLSEKLVSLHPAMSKVFYSGDGSCAVEVALKMSLHSRQLSGEHHRQHFIALANGYHGETLACLSVSDVGIYKAPYAPLCFEPGIIDLIPYVSGKADPLWQDCEHLWPNIEAQLDRFKDTATAIILEPLLQGAGGMKVYSADFLKRLGAYANRHNIHIICDEIMTGFGRTGKMLAIDHTDVKPDFICLSKGMTGGTLAMSAVLTSEEIYQCFYNDYDAAKTFLHSNTYCGNALAASVANAVFDVYENEKIVDNAAQLGNALSKGMLKVQQHTGKLSNIRQLGAMVAADLVTDLPRAGFQLFKHAINYGLFLRPLGNTIYWLPPLNMNDTVVEELIDKTTQAIQSFDIYP